MRLLTFLALFIWLPVWLALAGSRMNASPTAAAKKYHCWKIDQQNMFFGDCSIYACQQAVKIVFKNGKWINLAKAPDWQLYVLNPAGKIYCTTSLDRWKANLLQPKTIIDMKNIELVRSHEETRICGIPAIRLEYRMKNGRGVPRDSMSKLVYWVARDIELPDPISHIICGNSSLPQLHAIPLRTQATGEVKKPLDTTSITQVDMPMQFFDMPTGYKYTEKAYDVMDAGIGDIIKDMTGL